jgi:hypothetical protein
MGETVEGENAGKEKSDTNFGDSGVFTISGCEAGEVVGLMRGTRPTGTVLRK